ncbi:hypothetical protein LSH36_625g01079, partial [Paralvinella palmiformis]
QLGEQQPTWTCHICNRVLSTRGILHRHIRIHQGAYSVFCHICHKGFMDRTLLNGHLANKHQSAEKGFNCKYCGKKYGYNSHLTQHIKSKHLL